MAEEKKVKIRFTKNPISKKMAYQNGKAYMVSAAEAQKAIDAGIAIEVSLDKEDLVQDTGLVIEKPKTKVGKKEVEKR